ncbi:MAG: B12-binding domain-containing radical SAM protein [Thermoplasmata archaeon]
MTEVVLTADRGSFTDYGGVSTLGYVACMPDRIVPKLMMDALFTPRIKYKSNGEAIVAPYALRKVEAILLKAGFKDVVVAPPEALGKVIDKDTKLLGITVHDPYGLSPVSFKLTMLFGGGPAWNATFFNELSREISRLKRKYNFKVFAGGPATWQLALDRPDWLDTIYNGEAEVDLPTYVREVYSGTGIQREVRGKDAKVEEIPTIVKPARLGEVQVTRGCPRGCQFCSITPETYRTVPLEDVLKEVRINLDAGARNIELLTDDILLYGSKRHATNRDAVVTLFRRVKEEGAEQIFFPHISSPAVVESPETVMEISEIAEYKKHRGEAPVVGLESGSTRIITKYMRGKPFPYRPEDWGNVILESTRILNYAYITPAYTMTIGFPDETDEDVQQSIDLVQKLFDSGGKAWVFPLPVIPITSTKISRNPFPELEKLPGKYWELLYVSWEKDLELTRMVLPQMTERMNNRITKFIVNTVMDHTFSNIEDVFRELMETRGRKSYEYSKVELNSVFGIFRSIYWLMLTFSRKGNRKTGESTSSGSGSST